MRTIFRSGEVITIRDRAMKRVISEGPPVDFRGKLAYVAGPVIRGDLVVSCGPTTATRMEPYIYEFVRVARPAIIVGKGPLYDNMERAARDFGTIYAIFPGGCGALAAKRLRVKRQIRPELGMPESIRVLEAEGFGPLIPAIYADESGVVNVMRSVEERAKRRYEELFKPRVFREHVLPARGRACRRAFEARGEERVYVLSYGRDKPRERGLT